MGARKINSQANCLLITGGTSGIGFSLINRAIISFDQVIVFGRNPNKINETYEKELKSGQLAFHKIDFFESTELEQAFNYLKNFSISSVVHCMGGSYGFNSMSNREYWSKIWNLNIGFGHELNQWLLVNQRNTYLKRIVHISSRVATTFSGYGPYVTSKAALNAYIKVMARELFDKGIVVNGVSPGAINVPGKYLAKLGTEDPEQLQKWLKEESYTTRLGELDEVVSVILFLLKDSPDYLTGSIIEVDGGG
jgi:3-oxoacyl-[acyl-carrier protein] reductase